MEDVLSEVGQLSHGIDAMLNRAAHSAVGSTARATTTTTTTNTGDEDEEPMMAMFDEDKPSDIRAVDRMLASEAETMLASAAGHPDDAADDAGLEPESSLEGEFESVEGLLAGMNDLPRAAATAAVAAASAYQPPIGVTQASALANASASAGAAMTYSEESHYAGSPVGAFDDAESSTVPPVDLSLAPTQAAGIAAALAAASGAVSPSMAQAAASHAAPAIIEAPVYMPPAAPPEAAALRAAVQTASFAPAAIVQSSPAAPKRRSSGAGIGQSIASFIALTNLPLRYVPATMRPAVNMLALSLALWAPAVWAIAPMMAARAANTLPDVDMPVHGESSLDSNKAHGEAKADDGHGAGDAEASDSKSGKDPAATRKGGSRASSSSSKKSSAAKSAASH